MKILKMAAKKIWKFLDRRIYKRHSGSRIVKAKRHLPKTGSMRKQP